MRFQPRRLLSGVAALTVATGLALGTGGAAFAANPIPGFEPDAHATGSLTFFDANGNEVTSGSTSVDPSFLFVVGSTKAGTGYTNATLFGGTPIAGTDPLLWGNEPISAGNIYNPTSGSPVPMPANVAALADAGYPVMVGQSYDESMDAYVSNYPNISAAPNYTNIYELRLVLSGSTVLTDTGSYDHADVLYSAAAHTWTLLSPDGSTNTATTTTLTVSPPADAAGNAEVNGSTAAVTLSASVTGGTVPVGYNGPIGTIQFFDGTTAVGSTTVIAHGTAQPYTATANLSVANPSNHSYKAVFQAEAGTNLASSSSAAQTWDVSPPAPATSTTLTVDPTGVYAGDTNTYTAVVSLPSGGVCAGTLTLADNGGAPFATLTTPTDAGTCTWVTTNVFTSPGDHSVVAHFSPATVDALLEKGSASAAQTFHQDVQPGDPCDPTVGGKCTDPQSITATIPTGYLHLSTPYDAGNPLDLGTLQLSPNGLYYAGDATFGSKTDVTKAISITDTRAGNLPWTLQAQASDLNDHKGNLGSTISGENVGLTGLHAITIVGNGFDASLGNLTKLDNANPNPPVAPGDPGIAGLGNVQHDVAKATNGMGSVGLWGTLSLRAPSSTEPGTFSGTITFTLVGSLV